MAGPTKATHFSMVFPYLWTTEVEAQNLSRGDVVSVANLLHISEGGFSPRDEAGWVQVWSVYEWTNRGTLLLFENGSSWVGDPTTPVVTLAAAATLPGSS